MIALRGTELTSGSEERLQRGRSLLRGHCGSPVPAVEAFVTACRSFSATKTVRTGSRATAAVSFSTDLPNHVPGPGMPCIRGVAGSRSDDDNVRDVARDHRSGMRDRAGHDRSEERRVGKECRSGGWAKKE